MTAVPWSRAWAAAHLGERGFYRREAPAGHFATETHGDAVAEAIWQVVVDTDTRLGHPEVLTVVDVGAGSGELLTALLRHAREAGDGIDRRLRWTGIDVRPRPRGRHGDLDGDIDWVVGEAPQVLARTFPDGVDGVILAHEWLDDVPVDVVQRGPDDLLHHVLVDERTGGEVLGDVVALDSPQMQWLHRWWWPVRDRAEIGLSRDRAWRMLCASLRRGTALAVDYGHTVEQRETFSAGSLIGYVDGEACWPIPDGTMNITAHVAWDSLVAATTPRGERVDQVDVLDRLLPVPSMPAAMLAGSDPQRYADLLQQHTRRSRARDRSAGVSWLTWHATTPSDAGSPEWTEGQPFA